MFSTTTGIVCLSLAVLANGVLSLTLRPLDKSEESSASGGNVIAKSSVEDHHHRDHHPEDLEAAYAAPRASRIALRRGENRIVEEDIYKPADPYNFGYDVKDDFGNRQYRKEEADGQGVIRGSYGYTDANGLYRIVEYVADAAGFRANVKTNEPGLSNQNSADVLLNAVEPPRAIIEAASAPRPVIQEPPKKIVTAARSYSVREEGKPIQIVREVKHISSRQPLILPLSASASGANATLSKQDLN